MKRGEKKGGKGRRRVAEHHSASLFVFCTINNTALALFRSCNITAFREREMKARTTGHLERERRESSEEEEEEERRRRRKVEGEHFFFLLQSRNWASETSHQDAPPSRLERQLCRALLAEGGSPQRGTLPRLTRVVVVGGSR